MSLPELLFLLAQLEDAWAEELVVLDFAEAHGLGQRRVGLLGFRRRQRLSIVLILVVTVKDTTGPSIEFVELMTPTSTYLRFLSRFGIASASRVTIPTL